MTSHTSTLAGPLRATASLEARRRDASNRLNGTLLTGVILLIVIVLVAAVGPRLAPYAPDQFGLPLQPPNREHWFGTDNFGRDVLTRVVYGAHLNLLIGIVPTAVTFVVGIFVGSLAGYFGG